MAFVALAMLASASLTPVPLPDVELAELRGGFALPGGLNVAIAVQTDTRVDGSLLLRTVYRVDQAAPTLRVYAPNPATDVSKRSEASAAATSTSGGVSVMFDRQGGLRIGSNGAAVPAVAIVSTRQSGIGTAPANTPPVDLPSDGSAIFVSSGSLGLTTSQAGQQIRLKGDGLDVSHLVGSAIGSVIANSGSDRVIDTSTTVGLDISGATAANLGSAMLRIDTLATDATAQMLPR